MRVFISSTAYDLLDLRAELALGLSELGISPILSDDKLSDFRVEPNANSIETCLTNLRSCDEVLVLLDRRYGPSLAKAGFDDLSATHLEYRTARDKGIPVRFYVRDRTVGEYATWKKNGRSENVKFEWVEAQNDRRIFGLLEEHSKLHASSPVSNWFDTFINSLDLKTAVAKYFRPKVLPGQIVSLINRNLFPLFDLQVSEPKMIRQGNSHVPPQYATPYRIINVSGAAAFEVSLTQQDESVCDPNQGEIICPGQHFPSTIYFEPSGQGARETTELRLSYKSAIGVEAELGYAITQCFDRGKIFVNWVVSKRSFKRCDSPFLKIDLQ